MSRCHLVLVPGFAGFDMLGQLEYYAGVTPQFLTWQARPRGAVLHYFDNFPTAAVATRAARLRNYLAKRILRGEFAAGERIALVGHSTGGLDIRRLLWDLARHAKSRSKYSFDGVETPTWKTSSQILQMIRRVVFLSVPQWGTNIADWVKRHDLIRRTTVEGLRAAVLGSQAPLLDSLEEFVAAAMADPKHPDLLFAIRDALAEAKPACGGKGERGAMAQEAASELCLWLRHIDSDFGVIDDLTACGDCDDSEREPASPAHFGPALREQEQGYWHDRQIRTRSYATLGPSPEGGADVLYRLFYGACSSGPFRSRGPRIPEPALLAPRRGSRLRVPITNADNDGIVNTASMLWPNGRAAVLVECDHMDIVGHHDAVPAPRDSARKFRAYDLLRSHSGFHRAGFAQVWNEIFDFAVN